MFGIFSKSPYDAYIDSGMSLVEHYYKYGIYASNDILLNQNKDSMVRAYEQAKPLYSKFCSYLATYERQHIPNNFDQEKIVHFLMYTNAFAYGIQQKKLDEKTLRKLVVKDSKSLFANVQSFAVSSQGIHTKIFKMIEKIHDEVNPSSYVESFFR